MAVAIYESKTELQLDAGGPARAEPEERQIGYEIGIGRVRYSLKYR